MRRILLILSLSLFVLFAKGQSPVTNQRLFDTVGFMADHYADRLALFAKQPVATGKIIFLGNSITEMGDWKTYLSDTTVVNRGIGGDITFGVLKRLDEIIARKPAKLFLLIGINDIGRDIPEVVIADNCRKIIRAVQTGSPGTKIFLQSIMPVNPDVAGFPQHYDKQDHILKANQLLKGVAASTHCPFVNIAPLFTDSRGRLDAKYTRDGLHLTQEGGGYQKWVAFLREKGYL